MASIVSWAIALPSLRLPAASYAAWGGCSARGLKRKAVTAFDEDAVTLGATAGRACLERAPAEAQHFDALFVGATTLPYEEKPSSSSILSMLTGETAVRVVEIRGSPQAGLQALAAAADFCTANPGATAMAIATDAPRAHPASSFEHALGAGAAAFLVSAAGSGAEILRTVAVSRETFGSRMRRAGGTWREDRELRVDDDRQSLDLLARHLPAEGMRLATGLDPSLQQAAAKLWRPERSDDHWAQTGDLGAASAPVALADALDAGPPGAEILAVALGSGAIALHIRRGAAIAPAPTLADLAVGGVEIDYIRYLKETGFLARPGSGA
ncbi:MAG TPA: hypothetical protein VKS60_22700 [Stellaceae bacterium]|nr:hypothetical protein [Stellaceae bacterium]